jgi:hypothetical protein
MKQNQVVRRPERASDRQNEQVVLCSATINIRYTAILLPVLEVILQLHCYKLVVLCTVFDSLTATHAIVVVYRSGALPA